MHLVEAYAAATGSKIGEPYIYTKYFPIPFEKYVTIHPSSSMASKNYDFFNEVLQLISNDLKSNDIRIIQLGETKDPLLTGVIDFRGRTDLNQAAFILSNSLLHLSNDTFSIHVAGYFRRAVIGVYSVSRPSISGPYWNNPNKTIIFESERKGNKPSYAAAEEPKTINLIKPEAIAQAALDLLKDYVPQRKINIETVYVGNCYNRRIIEFVPDTSFAAQGIQGVINIRGDYHFDEAIILDTLSKQKSSLVLTRPVNTEALRKLKDSIDILVYCVDDADDSFVKFLQRSGINYVLYSEKDGEALAPLKLKYMDFKNVSARIKSKKETLDSVEKITDNSLFRTNRIIMSGGKFYPSKQHWLDGEPCETPINPVAKVKQTEDFWAEAQAYWVFNQQ